MRVRFVLSCLGCLAVLAVACLSPLDPIEPPGPDDFGPRCPKGTFPCGKGCMPADGICCDDGTRHTSNYCIGSSCEKNDRACQTSSGAQGAAEFCCGTLGTAGSNDCPAGQHHCGLSCKPDGEPCCAEGASVEDCPEAQFRFLDCLGTPAGVGCGVCLNASGGGGSCVSCPPDFCCHGDPCAGSKDLCVRGGACTGTQNSSGGASGSSGASSGSSGKGSCEGQCSADGDCGPCTTDADCCGTAICISGRTCIKSALSDSCDCTPGTDTSGHCVDFVGHGKNVTACGVCTADDVSACCPGYTCVSHSGVAGGNPSCEKGNGECP